MLNVRWILVHAYYIIGLLLYDLILEFIMILKILPTV